MIFEIILSLIWPVIIVFAIIFFLSRRGKIQTNHWKFLNAVSKEDFLSQAYLFLTVIFFGVTLFAISKDFNDLLNWRFIVLLTTITGFCVGYYYKTVYTLLIGVIGMLIWWGAQAFEWSSLTDQLQIKPSVLLLGIIVIAMCYYLLGQIHQRQIKIQGFSEAYSFLGLLIVTGVLFLFSTQAGLESFKEITKGLNMFASWQLSIFLISLLGVLLSLIWYSNAKKFISSYEVWALILLLLIFGVITLLPQQEILLSSKTSYLYRASSAKQFTTAGILWAVFFNALIFLELLGVLLLGYIKRATWLINFGALVLFLLIFVKYFDWFFTFMDKSLFFIMAGILFFFVGWLMERGRRYMIGNIKDNNHVEIHN